VVDSNDLMDSGNLGIGDCFDAYPLKDLPCSESFASEVYAIVALSHALDEPYPGIAMDVIAGEICTDAPERDDLGVIEMWFAPTPASWADGDQALTCHNYGGISRQPE
jgi:hypothetical protein